MKSLSPYLALKKLNISLKRRFNEWFLNHSLFLKSSLNINSCQRLVLWATWNINRIKEKLKFELKKLLQWVFSKKTRDESFQGKQLPKQQKLSTLFYLNLIKKSSSKNIWKKEDLKNKKQMKRLKMKNSTRQSI